MKHFRIVGFLALFFVLHSCGSSKTELAYKAPKGQKIKYLLQMEALSLKAENEILFVSNNGPGEKMDIDMTITRATFADNPEMEVDFKKYINTPFPFTIDPHGKILEPANYSNPSASGVNLKLFFPDYPTSEIQEGFSWKTEQDPQDIVFKTLESEFKVKTISEKEVVLEVTHTFLNENKIFAKDMKGTYVIDRETGWLVSADLDVHMTMNLSKNTLSIKRAH